MVQPKIKYEQPILIKQNKMNFPIEIINALGKRIICKQCSSCHACR